MGGGVVWGVWGVCGGVFPPSIAWSGMFLPSLPAMGGVQVVGLRGVPTIVWELFRSMNCSWHVKRCR